MYITFPFSSIAEREIVTPGLFVDAKKYGSVLCAPDEFAAFWNQLLSLGS